MVSEGGELKNALHDEDGLLEAFARNADLW